VHVRILIFPDPVALPIQFDQSSAHGSYRGDRGVCEASSEKKIPIGEEHSMASGLQVNLPVVNKLAPHVDQPDPCPAHRRKRVYPLYALRVNHG